MAAQQSRDAQPTRASRRRVTAGITSAEVFVPGAVPPFSDPDLGGSFDGGSAPKPPAEGSFDGGSAPKPPAEGSFDGGSAPKPPAEGSFDAASAPELLTDGSGIRPGDRLPGTRYVVVRPIGQGGMGEIYEGEHAELGRRVALKVLHRHHRDRADLAARLREEARILGRLRHPNLVEVFDLGVTSGGVPWFAMPLLRGRDLRDEILRRGPLPPLEAAALAAQALDGLAAAHAAGFVHRDVKLENLFLEEDGTLKVLDFGVAKIIDAGGEGRTDPGGSPGTPRSMAPEQCSGGAVDGRADVYAMGLVLYELCAGRGPFDDVRGNDHGLRFAHCERRPPAPSTLSPRPLPPALDALILRALAKSPADRFQTATEMAAAVRRLLEPGERWVHDVGPRSAVARSRRSAARARRQRGGANPWLPATLSALAIACFALGLAFGRASPGAPTPDRAGTARGEAP
jgi:tRNA A-37 threonylcarbamoyl transferase component Bud32